MFYVLEGYTWGLYLRATCMQNWWQHLRVTQNILFRMICHETIRTIWDLMTFEYIWGQPKTRPPVPPPIFPPPPFTSTFSTHTPSTSTCSTSTCQTFNCTRTSWLTSTKKASGSFSCNSIFARKRRRRLCSVKPLWERYVLRNTICFKTLLNKNVTQLLGNHQAHQMNIN